MLGGQLHFDAEAAVVAVVLVVSAASEEPVGGLHLQELHLVAPVVVVLVRVAGLRQFDVDEVAASDGREVIVTVHVAVLAARLPGVLDDQRATIRETHGQPVTTEDHLRDRQAADLGVAGEQIGVGELALDQIHPDHAISGGPHRDTIRWNAQMAAAHMQAETATAIRQPRPGGQRFGSGGRSSSFMCSPSLCCASAASCCGPSRSGPTWIGAGISLHLAWRYDASGACAAPSSYPRM